MGMVSSSDNWHGPIPPDEPETPEVWHTFKRSHFTGTTTCTECGLLPLDKSDYETECEEVNNETDRTTDV